MSLTFANKLIEQIRLTNNEQTPQIEPSTLNNDSTPAPQTASADVTTHEEQAHQLTPPDSAEAIILATSSKKEAPHRDPHILSKPSASPKKPPHNNSGLVKKESLPDNKKTLNSQEAWQLLHPDAFHGDLSDLSYFGGEPYLTETRQSIGRLWQTEDRRKPNISYTLPHQSNQPETYAFFTQEILGDLSEQLTIAEYTELPEDIQAKNF
ncbi:hypothetical protein PSP31121_05612 [Pandoraea sputorum]|uniref:Uncharacterized protein n=2 Tax=Pandoraea sputorum TaxID=93222 RepID=A0A5E5BNA2_9BURK|nr:hypothetical protein PSP31121_05612 [Pandoraea sputorum]